MSSVPVPNPAAPYRPTAPPAPLRVPPAPRRVSGPQRRPVVETVPRSRLSAALIRLIDQPLLERLVRGRVWIALVATALLGIVAMQVILLRLGAQIGSQTQAYNVLLQKAEATETAIGGIEANNRLSNLAGPSTGMVYAPPGSVTYLQVNPGDGHRAADRIATPTSEAIVAAAEASAPPAKPSKPAVPPVKSAGTTAGGASVASTGDIATTSQNALKSLPPGSGTGAPSGTQLATTTPASTVPVSGTATGTGTVATTGPTGGARGAVTTSAGGTTPPATDSTTSAGGTQTGP